ncbi:MAG: DNA mismatch repair protein MutL [Legionella sp.]|nr:MAG: DNA mismatch repair protein MutL [Legionella sp.]
MRIQRLSSAVANQIAAGEVIERPASVVKELLENALDAGATMVAVELGFGGLNHIKVSDNGHGIDAEDLPLAIAAHATSKISALNDLYHITTMGFRGEALASIASVSRLTLSSKPAHQAHGMMLSMDEYDYNTQPTPRNQGTTIEVRDLFFNAPVRKTFLKSERIEYQAIELVVKQFALSAPGVALTMKHNGKQTLNLAKVTCEQSRLQRIKKLFGQAFLTDAVYIDETHEHFAIQGWISQHTYQRSQRDRQWIYLNHRLVKDKLLYQAIGQAYQSLLHPGRYASCVLYISIAPDQVDVNVHPTKHEVRFRQPRLVHSMMVSILTQQLRPPVPLLDLVTELQVQPELVLESGSLTTAMAPSGTVLSKDAAWMAINAHFVILNLSTASYLVDMFAVHQHAINAIVYNMDKPWPHRLLLVPIRVDIERSMYASLERCQTDLSLLGIQFDFMAETSLMIRTIPLCLPLLDLGAFFLSIPSPHCDQQDLIRHAIACQSFDAYHMSSNERDALLAYCLQHWDQMNQIHACLRLDLAKCQALCAQGQHV